MYCIKNTKLNNDIAAFYRCCSEKPAARGLFLEWIFDAYFVASSTCFDTVNSESCFAPCSSRIRVAVSLFPTDVMPNLLARLIKIKVWLLMRCWLRLVCVRVLLLAFGFDRSVRILSLNKRGEHLTKADVTQWRERGQYFQRAAKIVPDARCLARAMALCHWARQCAAPAVLVIGVQRISDKTLAHAWSVICDEVVDDAASTIAKFTVVYRC